MALKIYKLVGKEIIPVSNLTEYVQSLNQDSLFGRVSVTETHDGDIRVSTVFLGIDHGFGGKPLLFETMVFGGRLNGYQCRYGTYDEAVEGHWDTVDDVFGPVRAQEHRSAASHLLPESTVDPISKL
jgi:hypothetical protein